MIRPKYLQALRQQTVKQGALAGNRVTFGTDVIDSRIEGGLAQRALHEVFAGSAEDGSAAAAFAVMISLRACPVSRPILWVRENQCGRQTGHLHAAGLAELGIDPSDLVLIDAPDICGTSGWHRSG